MASRGTHNTYLPGYEAVAHHEIRTAETCAAYLLPTLVQMAGQKPDLKLLDVGAGSGTITASLAKYMPHGRVTATDLSEGILARAARHAAESSIANVDFQPANVYQLPWPDDTFDIVHGHQVLLYLDEPVRGLTEMLRVTRPGGVVAIRNNDMAMWSWWPRLPGLEKFHRLQLKTHEAAGGTNYGGIQLLSWALRAGVPRPRITATQGTWSYSATEDRRVWGMSFAQRARTGALASKAMELGLATEADLEETAAAWEEWVAAEDGWFACLHGEILIRT